MQGADTNTGISYGTDIVTINTGGVARVTTDASGNVGVGTASPSVAAGQTTLEVSNATGRGNVFVNTGAADGTGVTVGSFAFVGGASSSNGRVAGIFSATEGATSGDRGGNLQFLTKSNAGSLAERMRIDSSGNLLVGATSGEFSEKVRIYSAGTYTLTSTRTGTGSEGHFVFQNGNGVAGTIFTSGTTTSYNTSSDYRLKENVTPMTGALEKVVALKPVTYTWKTDGSAGQGFIAHELQEVVPDCVTGEKDAVETVDDFDAEGKKIGTKEVPRYQGVDTSFLVATLVAAIQELKSEFDAYKATHP
jgi:hypothetical protein